MSTRNRIPIIALLTANTISQIGNVIALVAIPWFVLETTGSAAKTGLTGFFTVLPVVLAGFLGGAVVDRLGHRRTSIIADVFSGVTVALIPLLYLTVGLSLWQLLALVFLGALLDLPGSTARQSLAPELAELADIRLERVNASYQTMQQVASLVGPPLAGLLIVLVGTTQVLWLNAASFAISALLVAAWVPASVRRIKAGAERSAGYFADLIEGWQFIRREQVIFSLTVANAVGNFIGAPLFAVVLPVYASQVLGDPVDLGLMLSGAAVGTLCGALLYGAVGHYISRRWLYAGAWLVGTLPFWVMAGTPPLIIAIAALVILGFTDGPINPLMYTLSQERTPIHLRGRVFGARIALANIAAPLGMLTVGMLIERIGLSPTLLMMAAVQSAAAVYVLIGRGFHDLDRWSDHSPAGVAKPSGLRISLRPDWHLIGLALLLNGGGFAVFFTGSIEREISIGSVFAVGLIIAGWMLGGAALRPRDSRLLGAGIAAGLYALVGAVIAGMVALLQSNTPGEEVAPMVDGYSVFVIILLLWPIFVTRLADRRSRS